MMSANEWSNTSWRREEEAARARQAPAGLTGSIHTSLALPTLSLAGPSTVLTSGEAGTEVDASVWAAVQGLLKQTHQVQIPSAALASSSLSLLKMDSQNTQSLPRNSLAQKSLDFCIKNFMEPQKPKVPNFTSAVEWLENLDSSMLTPLQKQMDLQMLSLFPAPVPPQLPESPPKRSRSSISTDAKTPASALDSQASAPVTPVSRKHSQPSQRVNSSSAIPSSSTRHPTPRRATSLNSIVSTPAVEDDLRDVEVELRDGTWKNVLAKCVDATTSLLKADDLIQSGEIDSSPLIDPDTKLPVLAALDAIHRPFRRLVDMKKISEFVEAIEDEEGDGWIKRVVRVCEKVLTGCECIHLFVTKKESSGEDEDQANQDEDEKDDDGVDKLLHSSTLGLESASLLVSLLTHLGPTTNRRLYGEETITILLSLIKSRLAEILAFLSTSSNSPLHTLTTSTRTKKQMAKLTTKLAQTLTLLTLLFSHAQFTDSLIITTYVSLIPLFFTEPSTTVTSIGLEKLQTTCLHLLCTLFSRNPGHRVPMMEEIAGYLCKLQGGTSSIGRKSASVARTYKLRSSINASGKNIQMVSALVVSLIQSTFCGVDVLDCVHEVRDAVKAGRNEDGDGGVVGRRDGERIGVERLVGVAKQGLDSSQACGLFFFKYLIGRAFVEGKSAVSTPGKRGGGGLVGGGVETELRSVLENLVEDLVVLLGEPEWPGADFLVLLFCKMMTQALDDTKKNQDIPIKSLGLDFLGQLTSRLFSLTNVKCLGSKVEGLMDTKELESFANSLQGPIASESGGASMGKLSGLWEVQSFVVEYLKEERENDGGYDGARTFHVFNWIHTLSNTFTTISTQKEPLASTLRTLLLYYCDASDTNIASDRLPHTLLSKQSLPTDTLDPTTTLKLSAWCLLRRSHLYTLRENLLHYILASVDSETISLRARSLKALSDVVSVDASVLSLGSVKSVISNRLLDPSKSVRDAAVELVGGYLMREWNERLVEEYYPILVPRMLDVGPGVRKRVLKLMKEVVAGAMAQEVSDESEMSRSMSEKCVEVVVKLMGRVGDEETAVQDLAVKCLAEIWFSPFKTLSGSQGGGSGGSGKQAVDDSVESVVASLSKRSLAYVDQSVQGKFEIKSRTSLFLKVTEALASGVGNSVGAVDAIGDVIKKLLETNVVKNRDVVVVSRSLVECLTEGILVAEKNHEKDVIKTSLMLLNQISRVLPQLLLPHVKMLHMYLKGTGLPNNQADRAAMLNEERITAAVVSILGVVIPHTKDPDLSLMDAIEGDLLVLLSKRTLPVVNLIVPCLATIVHQVTKNYAKLTKVLKTCLDNFQKSRQMINSSPDKANALNPANARAVARGLIIVSLLVRNFDFDRNRALLKDQAAADIATWTNIMNTVCGYVGLFAGPTSSPELKSIALQALGNLFIANPRLMIKQDSQVLMNEIFQKGLISHRIELIKIFVEFLKTEQIRMMQEELAKKAANVNTKTVDIKVLIGNADEMADAGVSSAVMQMYLNYILEGLMSVDVTLSTTAFDAVCIIIEQGLAHPLLCVPFVIAMQTSVIPSVRDRAIIIYDNLAEKHQTFIHSRTGECVRKAFDYRMILAQSNIEDGGVLAGSPVWAEGYTIESHESEEEGVNGPLALLSNMYNKIQVKRPRRNEFLMTLVRSFDVDVNLSKDKHLIPFGRFVAENLATLNYKSADEVLNIIYHICQVLSVSGETVLKAIEDLKKTDSQDEKVLAATAKSSILMGMLVKLKTFFQKLYDLSESKCRRFAPSESSRNTEKSRPATRQQSASSVIDWSSWPFADSRLMLTKDDMNEQLDLFVELMNTDYYIGGSGEDEEDMDFEDPPTTVDDGDDEAGANDGDIPSALNSPAKPVSKGRKRLSVSTGSSAPSKKPRRSSLKGSGSSRAPSRVAFDAESVLDSPSASERPKRSMSRASVVDLSSDE